MGSPLSIEATQDTVMLSLVTAATFTSNGMSGLSAPVVSEIGRLSTLDPAEAVTGADLIVTSGGRYLHPPVF